MLQNVLAMTITIFNNLKRMKDLSKIYKIPFELQKYFDNYDRLSKIVVISTRL